MRILVKNAFWLVLIFLLIGQIYFFIVGIKLAANINNYEKEIKILQQENIELANNVYWVESLQYAASQAAELGFNQEIIPLYLDNLRYALNR